MEAVGERRNQVAELVRGGGETAEQQQLRARRIAGLAVEDVQSIDLGCPITEHVFAPFDEQWFAGSARCARALREFGQDGLELVDDPRVADLAVRVPIALSDRHRLVGDVGAVRPQHEIESVADVRAAPGRGDVEERDRLAVERAAADSPVERILERAGNTEGVLRDGKQHSARVRACLAEAQHCLGRFDLQVGVEMWQLPHGVVDHDEGAVSCRSRGGGTENGTVDRVAPQAAGQRRDRLREGHWRHHLLAVLLDPSACG